MPHLQQVDVFTALVHLVVAVENKGVSESQNNGVSSEYDCLVFFTLVRNIWMAARLEIVGEVQWIKQNKYSRCATRYIDECSSRAL